jgi:hypothetical protein
MRSSLCASKIIQMIKMHPCVWIFDSHKHPRSPATPRGMVLATIKVETDLATALQTAIDWIFNHNLYETNCHREFIECTVVVPGQAKANSDVSLRLRLLLHFGIAGFHPL